MLGLGLGLHIEGLHRSRMIPFPEVILGHTSIETKLVTKNRLDSEVILDYTVSPIIIVCNVPEE